MQYLNLPADASCPLCASGNCALLYTVDSRAAAQHFVLREVMPDVHEELRGKIESLWGGETCGVVLCRDCELTFADPFVAGDSEFYRLAYPQSHYPQWRWSAFVLNRQATPINVFRRAGVRRMIPPVHVSLCPR